MLKTLVSVLAVAATVAAPALAADDTDEWRFGGDVFTAGRSLTVGGEAAGDLFAAGDSVTAASEVGGSAHMAGRYVTFDARVGGNVYGAGMEVEVNGPVAGNVTIMGDTLTVSEPVSGNLRATGSRVTLAAPVAGSALVAGENVDLDASIGGDLALAAAEVRWGDKAVVAGELHVYADDPDAVEVPERVAPAERVIRHGLAEFDDAGAMPGAEPPGFFSWLRGWLGSILVIGLLGTIFAAVAPDTLARLRGRALDRPLVTGFWGLAGLSALVGSVLFLAMTGIGIVLIPVSLIAAALLGVAGYVVGTYAIGVFALGLAGRGMPDSTGDRAIAAFAGAAIGALIGLVPWLGWLAVMAIFLVGAGAVVLRLARRGEAAAA